VPYEPYPSKAEDAALKGGPTTSQDNHGDVKSPVQKGHDPFGYAQDRHIVPLRRDDETVWRYEMGAAVLRPYKERRGGHEIPAAARNLRCRARTTGGVGVAAKSRAEARRHIRGADRFLFVQADRFLVANREE